MALARFERDFTDEDGNLLTGNVSVQVRRMSGGLVQVYSDRAGTAALGNPFVNSGGHVAFHAEGNAYRVTVTQGAFSRELTYVPIGLAGETDFTFAVNQGDWDSGTTYTVGDYVVHNGIGIFISTEAVNLNNEPDDTTPASTAEWTYFPGLVGPAGATGTGLDVDAQVDDLAGRAAYDGEAVGFKVLVSDIGDGRAAVYVMGSGGSGDWSAPAYVTGPAGPIDGSTGSTDNGLLRADGTGGETLQSSGVILDDSDNLLNVGGLAIGAAAKVQTRHNVTAVTPNAQVLATSSAASLMLGRFTNDAFTSRVYFLKSRGTSVGSYVATQADDELGALSFAGADGSKGLHGATLQVLQNGSAGADYVPTRMVFATSSISSPAAPVSRLTIGEGLYNTLATGGDKGNNTINFGAVYDDNSLLTCMALQDEFLIKGEVDLDKWDAMVPDQVVPERVEYLPVEEEVEVEEFFDEPIRSGENKGALLRKAVRIVRRVQKVNRIPIIDDTGKQIDEKVEPIFERVVVPEQVIPRVHGTARLFANMLAEGFDPRDPAAYIARLKRDQALPGMPTRTTWEHNSLSSGEILGRLWLATEMLAIVVMNHEERLKALEGGAE